MKIEKKSDITKFKYYDKEFLKSLESEVIEDIKNLNLDAKF